MTDLVGQPTTNSEVCWSDEGWLFLACFAGEAVLSSVSTYELTAMQFGAIVGPESVAQA